ncbi:MAG: decaprenyl-phosphate phosphoribosyltransferase [Kiritimatiellia bacterium]
MLPLLQALRPSQWVKNLIVLAAYFFARWDPSQHGHVADRMAVLRVVAAAILFCLISSAIYLINDIRDVVADRAHPVKRCRPIAAGEVRIGLAWGVSFLLLLLGLGGAWLLSPSFSLLACGYVAMQLAYTCGLKRVALLDVFLIATGFVMRAMAGALVIDVRISPWLLLCTFLLALFLGLCKRRHEKRLLVDSAAQQHREALAGYKEKLLDRLISGTGAATVAAYAIYTLWPETVVRFGTCRLGLTIPFVAFGIFRYRYLVYQREQGGRPEKVLLTDRVLIATVLLYALAALAVLLTSHLPA